MLNRSEIDLVFPTENRILVEKIKYKEEVLQSGLILTPGIKLSGEYKPESKVQHIVEVEQEEEDNLYEVLVLAVGPTCKGVKKGYKCLINKYAGVDLFKDRTYILVNETDIVAVLGAREK